MLTFLLSLGVVTSAGLMAETVQDDVLPLTGEDTPPNAQSPEYEAPFGFGPSQSEPVEPRADFMDEPDAWTPVASFPENATLQILRGAIATDPSPEAPEPPDRMLAASTGEPVPAADDIRAGLTQIDGFNPTEDTLALVVPDGQTAPDVTVEFDAPSNETTIFLNGAPSAVVTRTQPGAIGAEMIQTLAA